MLSEESHPFGSDCLLHREGSEEESVQASTLTCDDQCLLQYFVFSPYSIFILVTRVLCLYTYWLGYGSLGCAAPWSQGLQLFQIPEKNKWPKGGVVRNSWYWLENPNPSIHASTHGSLWSAVTSRFRIVSITHLFLDSAHNQFLMKTAALCMVTY